MGIKKVPFDYEHPSKRKTDSKNETPVITAPKVSPKNKKGMGTKQMASSSRLETSKPQSGMVLLRLVVKPPKQGNFRLYDDMIDSGISPKQAILGLLKRGFSEFENDLQSNKVSATKLEYETEGSAIETTRSVDEAFNSSCREIFDKFDLLSNRALGGKIGEAIFSRVAKGEAHVR